MVRSISSSYKVSQLRHCLYLTNSVKHDKCFFKCSVRIAVTEHNEWTSSAWQISAAVYLKRRAENVVQGKGHELLLIMCFRKGKAIIMAGRSFPVTTSHTQNDAIYRSIPTPLIIMHVSCYRVSLCWIQQSCMCTSSNCLLVARCMCINIIPGSFANVFWWSKA